MLRAVLDTNVIVSGTILSTGAPGAILDAWRERRFELLIAPALLTELDRVLRRPKIAKVYAIDRQDVRDLLDLLSAQAILVTAGRSVAAALRDPTGTPVLACAVEGHADYVVTGDRDLLDLGRFRDIPIVSPAAFAALLQANE